jgi:hypothetical protein
MSVVRIQANSETWRFAPLPPPAGAALLQIVAQAQLVDDVSLLAPATAVEVTSSGPFLGRAGPDGLVGVIGRPLLAGPSAQIVGLPLAFTVTAPGYQNLTLNGALPAQPGLPNAFQPLDFGRRRLIRAPAVIQGRVFRRVAGVFQPTAGAIVRIQAATPVPPLAGALPVPTSVGWLVGLTATADAYGQYRFTPLERFSTLTLQVTAPALAPPVVVAAPLGRSDIVQDFRLN